MGVTAAVKGLLGSLQTALVMDDQAEVGATVAAQLGRMGIRASVASSHDELVNTLAARHPDLIVLDLSLGETDAVEILEVLASVGFAGATLLISGHAESVLEHAERIGRRAGVRMAGCLRKPFRLDDLKQALSGEAPLATETGSYEPPESEQGLLGLAMRWNWLDCHYQPKVELATGRIVGAECLARMHHPRRGLLSPAAFIDTASNDELEQLLWFTLSHALRTARSGAPQIPLDLSVNLSGRTIERPGLVERLRDLRKERTPDLPITLELTETDLVKDQTAAETFATRAALHGFRLSIDDFGTGYATFDRLRSLPFHELKLDRSVVSGCSRAPAQRSICRAAVSLAHDFGADAVAEGVESAEDLEVVRELGFDLAQGHLFSPAVSVATLAELEMLPGAACETASSARMRASIR